MLSSTSTRKDRPPTGLAAANLQPGSSILGGRDPVSELVVGSTAPGVDLVPASPSLVRSGERPGTLSGSRSFAVPRLPDYWDLVLVDTPPTIGYLSLAPLVPSDHVLIPVEAHALAIPGAASVIASIERARRHVNPRLEILRIVACRVNQNGHVRDVVGQLRGSSAGSSWATGCGRRSDRGSPRTPASDQRYAPTSHVADDYRAVADELLDRMGDLGST